jgi:nucleoside-diphosphate-sugar epimerase
LKIFILGADGFIGHALVCRILKTTSWTVTGVDLVNERLRDLLPHPRFSYIEADLRDEHDLIDRLVGAADVVVPLAAQARPAEYVRDPLGTFELDFEENLRIVRVAVKTDTRLIFPSTSEVYGMCEDAAFNEKTSRLVLGPIAKERWIYSCCKQLLDRVIWAYGREGLRFTIFRPFNWFGPNLDDIRRSAPGSARVVTQFLGHLLRGQPVQLVDGGQQCRTFTYIDDGISGLMRILENDGGRADGGIFNLGNPANCVSIRTLAETMIDELGKFPELAGRLASVVLEELPGSAYYGESYEDVPHRAPDISDARRLGWAPQVSLRDGLRRMIAHELASGHWSSPRAKRAVLGDVDRVSPV